MSDWKENLARIAINAETAFDTLKEEASRRLGLQDPLMIQPYVGFGTRQAVRVPGRVLENEGVRAATDRDTVWDNLLNMYRQLESDEIAGAVVQGELAGVTATAVSNEEGYFTLQFTFDTPLSAAQPWQDIRLTLTDAPNLPPEPVTARARVLVPPKTAVFGIISDIDDTVMISSATNYLRAAQLLFLGNARTRLPFSGVSALYQALQHGAGQQPAQNPLFYVSSSPRNVFLLLTEFFSYHDIPQGPLFLRDYGLNRDELFGGGHHDHKLAQIDEILTTYPRLPFVLIGDSGQEDPEIYAEVVARYPGRIRAIYIRDVTDGVRDTAVDIIAEQVQSTGVAMLRVADSLAVAQHAVDLGLLRPEAVAVVADEVNSDVA